MREVELRREIKDEKTKNDIKFILVYGFLGKKEIPKIGLVNILPEVFNVSNRRRVLLQMDGKNYHIYEKTLPSGETGYYMEEIKDKEEGK